MNHQSLDALSIHLISETCKIVGHRWLIHNYLHQFGVLNHQTLLKLGGCVVLKLLVILSLVFVSSLKSLNSPKYLFSPSFTTSYIRQPPNFVSYCWLSHPHPVVPHFHRYRCKCFRDAQHLVYDKDVTILAAIYSGLYTHWICINKHSRAMSLFKISSFESDSARSCKTSPILIGGHLQVPHVMRNVHSIRQLFPTALLSPSSSKVCNVNAIPNDLQKRHHM